MTLVGSVGVAVGITALVTFVLTNWFNTSRMEKRYVTREQCEVCMENLAKRDRDRRQFRESIKETLKSINSRLMLGNLVMADLCDKAEIPESKIKSYEKSLGIKLREDNNKL